MLKQITEEEAKELMKENPEEQVAIFYDANKQWYNIKGMSMDKVGEELMIMADIGLLDERK